MNPPSPPRDIPPFPSLFKIIFLALPGVILGATLTAIFIKLVLPYDWDWELCFVFGSMVAATDPVAVVALLEELVSHYRLCPCVILAHFILIIVLYLQYYPFLPLYRCLEYLELDLDFAYEI